MSMVGLRRLHHQLIVSLASTSALRSASARSYALNSQDSKHADEGGDALSADPGITHVAELFNDDAEATAERFAEALSPAQRVILASALQEKFRPEQMNETYVQELFKSASNQQGVMTEGSFAKVIMAHSFLNKKKITAPDANALKMLFLASAIPFLGFGFLDNFIMLTAGEEIDAVFGVRLGLTTLASAGLGNLVADVVGVGAANGIERNVRRLPFLKSPNLSRAQESMGVVKAAKLSGSLVGVSIGCLLGLAPLALSGHFFRV